MNDKIDALRERLEGALDEMASLNLELRSAFECYQRLQGQLTTINRTVLDVLKEYSELQRALLAERDSGDWWKQ